MRIAVFLFVVVSNIPAQTGQSQPVTNAGISGMVREKGTGRPLKNFTVSTFVNTTWVGKTMLESSNGQSRPVQATTDESGHYRLGDLPAGSYRIAARDPVHFGSTVSRTVQLAGHDLDDINFEITVYGTITGRVLDENKEPVPGINVMLIGREYYLGAPGYFFRSVPSKTNDRGEYRLEGVEAGRPYLIVAEKREMNIPAHSGTPLNPKLRRRIPIRTWYLNAPSADSAAPITVRSGQMLEGVDIQMRKSQSYCAEGKIITPNGPAALDFAIEPMQPSSGTSANGGIFFALPHGVTGSDGEFRICDLYPGTYRITANTKPNGQTPNFGVLDIAIQDEDLKGLKLAVLPGTPLAGEVVLDGEAPDQPLETKLRISMVPLFRAPFREEFAGSSVRADIPGTLSFPGLLIDDYFARVFVNGSNLYVKDVTFAGRSVMYGRIRLGAGLGGGLRVIVGRDGAKVSATVTDKDGNPVGDTNILVMPRDIDSEAILAERLVKGQTDQNGQFTSQVLAPGKYYVAATADSVDPTPESIGRLWRSRTLFGEVDLNPNGTSKLNLIPIALGN